MLWIIGIVLLVLWICGWLVFKVAGFFIHLLLLLAVILFVVKLFTRPTEPTP